MILRVTNFYNKILFSNQSQIAEIQLDSLLTFQLLDTTLQFTVQPTSPHYPGRLLASIFTSDSSGNRFRWVYNDIFLFFWAVERICNFLNFIRTHSQPHFSFYRKRKESWSFGGKNYKTVEGFPNIDELFKNIELANINYFSNKINLDSE